MNSRPVSSTRTKIDEADLIAVVLDVAPVEYQSVLTAKQSIKKLELTLLYLYISCANIKGK
jgi:hypothetical protein